MMKLRGILSGLLAAVLLTTGAMPALAAQEIVTQDLAINITVCEYVRAVVVEVAGKQPLAMDAHYATSYMSKAVELGLIEAIPMEKWDTMANPELGKKLLEKLTDAQRVAVEKALEGLLVHAISVDGKTIDLIDTPVFVRNGNVMVPVRKTAEALGFTVSWIPNTYRTDLDNGAAKTQIEIGLDSYYKASSQAIGMTQAKPMGTSPMLVGGNTYVPAQLFDLLFSKDAVAVKDGVMTIAK